MESRIKENVTNLFTVFLEIHEPSKTAGPVVKCIYPKDYSDTMILDQAPKFAFPCSIKRTTGEYFTFILTEEDNYFHFGYCLYEVSSRTCICLMSYIPWFGTIRGILQELSSAMKASRHKLKNVLEHIFQVNICGSKHVARREENVTIKISEGKRLILSSRKMSELPTLPNNVDYSMLIQLGAKNLLVLLGLLLKERRIIFVSNHLSHLSAYCFGCMYLTYPLCWQSVFIPILPEHLINFVAMPYPYIVGVHTNLWTKISREANLINECAVINIDEKVENHRIFSPFGVADRLPRKITRFIKENFKLAEKLPGRAVAKTFLYALIYLLGDVEKAIVLKNGSKMEFDCNLYLKNFSEKERPFVSEMTNTLMFTQFVEKRIHSLIDSNSRFGAFDKELKLVMDAFKQSPETRTARKNVLKFMKMKRNYMKKRKSRGSSLSEYENPSQFVFISRIVGDKCNSSSSEESLLDKNENDQRKFFKQDFDNKSDDFIMFENTTKKRFATDRKISDVTEYRRKSISLNSLVDFFCKIKATDFCKPLANHNDLDDKEETIVNGHFDNVVR